MNITVDRQRAVTAGRHRRVPWSPRAWSEALYLASAIPVQLAGGIAGGLAVFALVRWSAEPGSHDARQLLVLWLAAMTAVFLLSPVLTRVHRHRLRATASLDIPPQPKRRGPFTWSSLVTLARSQATWRQLCFHLLVGPALALSAVAAAFLWLAGLLGATVYLYGWGLSPGSLVRQSTYPNGLARLPHLLGDVPLGVGLTAAGFVALLAAPWLTAAITDLDLRTARALLGPSRADELAHRVEQLTETRAGVVDAADAERRRLERDLHDGTQQRLVSLAMNLGMARAQGGTAEQSRQAIAEAHEEAKAALAELRDLIRGLHPAVLEDRGLDAALSGIAARMPIPVRLTVDLPRRPAPVIEAVAYFVVSEGLANIVKHAEATEAAVFVQRAGDRLHVIVTDDGVGGADPARGTGLAGLARRAASVDGTFDIDSPPSGPTLLTVDLPCNR
ncbi:MAG TPA: histidine kinase [Trebonia sp.]